MIPTPTNRKNLETLETIQIRRPCPEAWVRMKGNDRVRFCGKCRKKVYNLSGMSRREAIRLIEESEGPVCVRFYRRSDGTVLTEDCSLVQVARAKFAVLVAAALSLVYPLGRSFLALDRTETGDAAFPATEQSLANKGSVP